MFQVVLKCVNRLGFAAIGGRNLHCRVCRRREESPPGSREAWAVMEGIVEKGACSGPDKVEHQQTHPACASCRSDMQSKFGVFPRIIEMLYRCEKGKTEAQSASNGQVLMMYEKRGKNDTDVLLMKSS